MSKEAQIKKIEIFQEVNRAINQEEYPKALKLLDRVLEQDANCGEALYCKLYLLMRTEKFNLALTTITKLESLPEDYDVEFSKAYSYYRLNKLLEAKNVVNGSEHKEKTHYRNLNAQLAFKTEDFMVCIEIYTKLLLETSKDNAVYHELLTNYQAAVGALLLSGSHVDEKLIKQDASDTYELIYNLGCIYVAKNDYQRGLQLLLEAKELCRKSCEDGEFSQDEIEQELAPIMVQIAFIYQQQNQLQKALQIYEGILATKSADKTVLAVASNNLVATRDTDEKVFDSVLKLLRASDQTLNFRLLNYQKSAILSNEATLLLTMGRYPSSREKAVRMLALNPKSDAVRINTVIALCRQNKLDKAIHDLQSSLKSDPTSITVNLILAQLYIRQNDFAKAASQIEALRHNLPDTDSKFLPGLVGSLVWLYESTQQDAKAAELLNQAYSTPTKHSAQFATVVRRQLARRKLNSGKAEAAVQDFKELLEQNPDDDSSKVGLIQALSHLDVQKAKQYLGTLPDVEVNSDLEEIVKGFDRSAKRTFEPIRRINVAKRRSRKHKNKPAKDTSGRLDLERWLPLKARSYYKPGKNKQIRGSQGAVLEVQAAKGNEGTKKEKEGKDTRDNKNKNKAKATKGKKKKGGW